MAIIELDNVSKLYRAERGGRALVGRGGILGRLRATPTRNVPALEGISFEVAPGEALGIIGANGSGKSTLLKIIAGVTVPTEGTVTVRGRVASLLELGAGFHPMLTGRENVYLNAGIYGMRRAQVDQAFDAIVDFSGIHDAIDHPVDTYSSGMYVRLAFAVAVHVNPDVFLVDEVLSVGDEAFQRKCRTRIGELMEQGKTIAFVSHDLGIVNTLCDRVILLSGGKMIARDTAANAITFYLRQVGGDRGVRTFSSGPLEAIVCDGRLSVFFEERELTAGSGFEFAAVNLGQWHQSVHADWTITEAGDTGCVARGRLPKLPVILVWRLYIEDGSLHWRIAIECERAADIDKFMLVGRFPTTYTRWTYDEEHGEFPEIRPDDTLSQLVTFPELACERASLAADDLPNLEIHVLDARPNVTGHWVNSRFMDGTRQFLLEEHQVSREGPLSEGEHDVMALRITPDVTERATPARRYTIESGPVAGRFDRGRVRLSYEGREITSSLHVYGSMLINHLWSDSSALRWESFSHDGDTLRFRGTSRRFPYSQTWELSPVEGGIALTVWLDVEAPLRVEEHQTSVVLHADYASWETEHESGAFPEFDPALGDWQHLNSNYALGRTARASGLGLPEVRFEADIDQVPSRMTAINTTAHQRSRVLQALRTAEHGEMHFEPGRHLYFSGRMLVG